MVRSKGWLAGVLVLGAALQVAATENDGGAYQNGAEGFMTGALPPPGQYFLNYLMYYNAGSLQGNDGHSVPIDFHATAVADAMRFINVTPITILGGNWAQHVIVPLVWEEVEGNYNKNKNTAIGDIDVDPFIVGWHKPPFHWVVGLDTYIPVGKYHDGSDANIGNDYWTFEPILAATYLNEGGQELSAKMMYDINTRNEDTEYRSGQSFHVDFAAGQHLGNWEVGLGGYWYYQTTDDRRLGAPVDGGNQGRQIALGPQISYQYCNITLLLAYDREFASKDRPQGDRVWLKAVIPL